LIFLIRALTASVGHWTHGRCRSNDEFVAASVDGAGEPVQFRDGRVGAVDQPAAQVLFGGVAGSAVEDCPEVLGIDPGAADLPIDVAESEDDQAE
jgi:hypothetical protein